MATIRRTQECFPTPMKFGAHLTIPAPEPAHERCAVKFTTKGVLGGWVCPCPCHHQTESET